jgi:hypothetical protein
LKDNNERPEVLKFLSNLPIDLSHWYTRFKSMGLGTPKELFGAAAKQSEGQLYKAMETLFPEMPKGHIYFLIDGLITKEKVIQI